MRIINELSDLAEEDLAKNSCLLLNNSSIEWSLPACIANTTEVNNKKQDQQKKKTAEKNNRRRNIGLG